MKFVTFTTRGGPASPGVWLEGRGVIHLQRAAEATGGLFDVSSLLALLRARPETMTALKSWVIELAQTDAFFVPASDVHLEAPLRAERNPFCVGRNYREHVAEGHRARGTDVKYPDVPQFFTKATHAINRPDGTIALDPSVTAFLDYEVELAVVLGKGGRDIPAESALGHVFGYTIANDVTARDLQRRHDQWFKGKSLDGTLPLGPWIVDAEEIGDPRTLRLRLDVNGEIRQDSQVDMMIFDIPTIIATLSRGMTLEAGDIICTGTPSGVGYAMQPPCALQPGDLVTCEIDRIGRLRTKIVAS
jgi:2-keto-4-pentenoate hydratase/2-oxohepta-3-ene-1,7-dioic acid hydratase in catechol pathway